MSQKIEMLSILASFLFFLILLRDARLVNGKTSNQEYFAKELVLDDIPLSSRSSFMDNDIFEYIYRDGGVSREDIFNVECVKCFVVYVINNDLYVIPRTVSKLPSTMGGLKKEEVLTPLYSALYDLKRQQLRIPNTVFLMVLGDKGYPIEKKNIFAITFPKRKKEKDEQGGVGKSILIPGPEWSRPRVACKSDSYPRNTWIMNFRSGHHVPWEDKTPAAIWRGQPFWNKMNDRMHINRANLCKASLIMPDILDAKFSSNKHHTDHDSKEEREQLHGSFIDFHDHAKWKIIMDVDGVGWSSTFLHRLMSGSVVVKIESDYEDIVSRIVRKEKHYLLAKQDTSDLRKTIETVLQWNKTTYENFVDGTRKHIMSVANWDQIKAYWIELLLRYSETVNFPVRNLETESSFWQGEYNMSYSFVPCHTINNFCGCVGRRKMLGYYCTWSKNGFCEPSVHKKNSGNEDCVF